jgi:hypothetical protein
VVYLDKSWGVAGIGGVGFLEVGALGGSSDMSHVINISKA